jgi:hypothetical protein
MAKGLPVQISLSVTQSWGFTSAISIAGLLPACRTTTTESTCIGRRTCIRDLNFVTSGPTSIVARG